MKNESNNIRILESASKIVFILMAIASIGLTFIGMLDPKDFMILTSAAFTFYFSNKGDETNNYLQK